MAYLLILAKDEELAQKLYFLAKEKGLKAEVLGRYLVLSLEKKEEVLEFLLKAPKEFGYVVLESLDQDALKRVVPTKRLEEVLVEFSPEMLRKLERETKVFFQPIVKVKEGKVFGYEALARTPTLSVSDYLAFGKSFSFVERVCKFYAVKHAKERLKGDYYLFLNFSPNSLVKPERLLSVLEIHDFPASKVVLEITEDEKLDVAKAEEFVKALRSEGIKVALDDFGKGHSNLFCLTKLKPDFVKIDLELIRDVQEDKSKQNVVKKVVELCKDEGILVVAEGVEKKEEFSFLLDLGVDYAQGFLFGKPEEVPDVAKTEEELKNLLK